MNVDKRVELLQNILEMNLEELREFLDNYCDYITPLEDVIDVDVLRDEGLGEQKVTSLFPLSGLAYLVENISECYEIPKRYVEVLKGIDPEVLDKEEVEIIYESEGEEMVEEMIFKALLLKKMKETYDKSLEIFQEKKSEFL